MTSTPRLGLPLVQAAQAQKHVTVNEALSRLDGLVQLVLRSATVPTPPAAPAEGEAWGIPAGATGAWQGQDGKVAHWRNGGWDFITPASGWRAFVADRGVSALHDGTSWVVGMLTLASGGSGIGFGVVEFDHVIAAGAAVSLTIPAIPSGSVVFGVTGRVVTAIGGTLTAWQLGNPGAAGRYGSGLGLAAGSFVRGVLGQPTAFYADTALQLDATGGTFAGGTVHLAIHYAMLSLPRP